MQAATFLVTSYLIKTRIMKLKLLFIAFLSLLPLSTVVAQENATAILNRAYAQAAKEDKNVLVIFHASWCGWCKKMDKNMQADAVKKYFTDNYVTTHLTVQESPKNKSLETPGGEAVMERYKATSAGLPFWVILDSKGTLLADSFDAKGENLGCPSSAAEVAVFTDKLKKTSKLNAGQLSAIAQTFTIKK